MSALAGKSITQLRSIAQGMGCDKIFEKSEAQLRQDIELKQQALIPPPPIVAPLPMYDARLMTKPPSKRMTADEAREWVQPYIAQGMKFSTDDEMWRMSFNKKNDQGTLRMPARTLIGCAARLMA